jgi:hypothetical protein
MVISLVCQVLSDSSLEALAREWGQEWGQA